MAGGTFEQGEKKVLPGFYMRFIAAALASIRGGTRGIVAVPVKGDWGPVAEAVAVTNENELNTMFGTNRADGYTANLSGYLALLGGARVVRLYRMADGTEAKSTYSILDGADTPIITVSSKYPTSRSFSVTIRDSATDTNLTEAIFYEGARRLFTVFASKSEGIATTLTAAINDAPDNTYFDAVKLADGNGTVKVGTSQPFTAGADGISGITNQDYINAMTAFEAEDINGFAFDGPVSGDILQSARTWINRIRDEGKKVRGYFGGSDTEDQTIGTANTRSRTLNAEGLINVGNSVKLNDVWYNSAQTAIWLAGLSEGQPLTESLTFAATPFTDVRPKLTNIEMQEAQNAGTITLFSDKGIVKINKGINTLTTLGTNQDDTFKKIKIIKLRDSIYEDIYATARDNYIGKVPNNPDGQASLLGAINAYLNQLSPALLVNPLATVDEAAMQEANPDEFYWQYTATEVDNMDYIYGTGHVGKNVPTTTTA